MADRSRSTALPKTPRVTQADSRPVSAVGEENATRSVNSAADKFVTSVSALPRAMASAETIDTEAQLAQLRRERKLLLLQLEVEELRVSSPSPDRTDGPDAKN